MAPIPPRNGRLGNHLRPLGCELRHFREVPALSGSASRRILESVSPRPTFNQVVHEPTRLKICTTLTPLPELEYGRLQDLLALTAPTLSKHLRVLVDAGYVSLDKRARDGHVRTWVSLTGEGREALCGHVSEIQRMARVVRVSERRFPGVSA